MTIHDDARAAAEKVYDTELARRSALLDAAAEQVGAISADRDRIATALATSEDDLSAERDLVRQLRERIAELEGGNPPAEPSSLEVDPDVLLATGDWVTFESLMRAGDAVTVSTDAQGGKFRAFGAGAFKAIVSRVAAGKGIVFDFGTYEINEPGWPNGDSYTPGAIRLPKTCLGAVGRGHGGTGWGDLKPTTQRTVIRVKPNTGPEKNVQGAWFQFGFSGSVPATIANIHFEGTAQGQQFAGGGQVGQFGIQGDTRLGRVFTNLYGYNCTDKTRVIDVLSTGWSGTNGAPPGETFGVQVYMASGGEIQKRVNVDGRREAGGPIYGAAGFTSGNSIGSQIIDCYAHHCGNAGFVAYQSVNGVSENLILGDPTDKTTLHAGQWRSGSFTTRTAGSMLNHERTSGWVHRNVVLNTYITGETQQRPHVAHSGDAWSLTRGGVTYPTKNGTLELVDPTYSSILFSGKLAIETWNNYSPESAWPVAPVVRKSDGTRIPYKWSRGGTWSDQ